MQKRLVITIALLLTIKTFSQYQHPPNIKWLKIKTPHFNVIAPEELTKQLYETANLLEYVHTPVSSSMYEPNKKLNVFLFNQSALSNGYVTQAPTYSAYYTTPPQDANMVGGSDWLQTLALHEYRHYIQFQKLDNHFTYFAGSLFGDFGKAFLMNLSVPAWFFEGDAICSETALSASGRGRLPAFTRDIRANELENIRYKYDKAYLGSYKNYIPNHYYLGYILSSGIRKNYGIENWNKALAKSSKTSFWPYAFGGGLASYGGGLMRRSYREVLNDYKTIWAVKAEKHTQTSFDKIRPNKKVYTDYKFPFELADGSILCLKSGLASPKTLTIISENSEQEIKQINPIDRVHSNGELVVWSTENYSIRWGQKSFSDVMLMNIKTKKIKKITNKQKYFAPSISPDGDKIAAIEFTTDMVCSIVIISATNGELITKHSLGRNCFARMPSWSSDQSEIVFTQTYGQKTAISVLEISTNTIKNIIPFEHTNISSPIFYKNYILYNSPEIGIDIIAAIDTSTKNKTIVASGKYGLYEVSISTNKKTLSFENYSTEGFNIGQSNINMEEWLPVNEYANVHDNYFQHLVDQEGKGNIFEDYNPDSIQHYETKKYRPILHSIKVHSWAPYPVINGIGFSVFSNDYLNTMSASASINYYPESATYLTSLNLSYAKYFPIINGGISYGRRYESYDNQNIEPTIVGLNEKILMAGISIPLNLSRRVWQTDLLIKTAYNLIDQNYSSVAENTINLNYKDFYFSAINLGVEFRNSKLSSIRDINPRFGQTVIFNSWHNHFTGETNGSRQSVTGTFYFPGIAKHHSITIKGAHERNNDEFRGGLYTISTDIEFVRGYEKPVADYYYNAKAIYTLPLLYPDLSLGPIMYIKRISTAGFYDFGTTNIRGSNFYTTYNSIGFDLNFEFNPFRMLYLPLSMGIRTSYLIEKNAVAFEFIMYGQAF